MALSTIDIRPYNDTFLPSNRASSNLRNVGKLGKLPYSLVGYNPYQDIDNFPLRLFSAVAKELDSSFVVSGAIANEGQPTMVTQTEQALRLFSSSADLIPGVISTSRYHIGRLKEEGVMVVVADLFSTITHDVIRAKEMVYDTFPGIRFSIDIKDVSTVKHSEK